MPPLLRILACSRNSRQQKPSFETQKARVKVVISPLVIDDREFAKEYLRKISVDINIAGSAKLTKTDDVSIELSRTFAANLKSFSPSNTRIRPTV